MPRASQPTSRERVFRFVRDRLLAGAPPTVREVQAAMGFEAIESARRHLEALVDDGRLQKEPGRARGYRLPVRRGAGRVTRVPMLGAVQAGDLRAAIEDPDGYLVVERRGGAEELFALRVTGDSMIGAGILPGDIVIVRRQSRAEHGELVVAMVDGEATVKTLRLRGRNVELRAANPAYPPIVPPRGELVILGRVVEVRRSLHP